MAVTQKRFGVCAFLASVLAFSSAYAFAEDICPTGEIRALVLSGGGTKGAYEAAVAYHLIKHRGCDFKDFSGVSAGALNVSVLAQAPTGPDSLKNLQGQVSALIDIWRTVTDPSVFMSPRFLGKLRIALFGLEALNDFTPLKGLIGKYISVQKLRQSGRTVRVGYSSFYDGGYREISPDSACLHPEEENQYLDYVFASALIPVYGDMPIIRQPGDSADRATWTQFADGGVRHTTPIPGYFPNSEILPIIASAKAKDLLQDPCGAGQPAPHPRPIQDLYIVVAGPYKPLDDRVARIDCNGDSCQVHDGRDIAFRAIAIALESPARWDINYAITANAILKWREEASRLLAPGVSLGGVTTPFPVSSFNPGPKFDLAYKRMPIITPNAPLTEDTFEISERTMLQQLSTGCLDANAAMERLGGVSMKAECEREFPAPPR